MTYKRDLKSLKISQCPYQEGARRFHEPRPAPDSSPYDLSPFRNNLVAFSQYYNLCFVAAQDHILVHSPMSLRGRLLGPRSYFPVHRSGANLRGYIDPVHPHAINHLVVADLGHEELVIVATDDGDVVAYTTRSIRNDIHVRMRGYRACRLFCTTVKPYYIRNCGASAWGLAVHGAARMIAVSCNSHDIYVIAFALGRSSSDTPDDEIDWEDISSHLQPSLDDEEPMRREPSPSDRSQDQWIVLSSHQANIPNIAFYNPYDPDVNNVFLASTDIHGSTIVWDVWKKAPFFQPGTPIDHTWGWGLLCIDPDFAQRVQTTSELIGVERGIDPDAPRIDITAALSNVPDYEDTYFATRERRDNPAGSDASTAATITDDGVDDDDDEGQESFHSGDNTGIDSPASECSSVNISRAFPKLMDPPRQSTFYVLHSTRRDVRLLQFVHKKTSIEAPMGWRSKEVLCQYLLDQHMRPVDRHMRRLQRLNIMHQVPELNLVIVGDQMGRVALLTMTGRRAASGQDGHEFGFRVEAFLPFSWQEDGGKRPKTELLGVAVAPVQGHERQREDLFVAATGVPLRRWRKARTRAYRVMLYYLDHTVLSYEISRVGGGEMEALNPTYDPDSYLSLVSSK
ncbi:MAG: hypothetical protein Q9168_002906 [Polycauliona sp. 1 TL-2023]